jgi:hypothetical protein
MWGAQLKTRRPGIMLIQSLTALTDHRKRMLLLTLLTFASLC